MTTHTTNYQQTFIEVADDCPVTNALIPPFKQGQKTVANLHYELIANHPYKYTSDDVLFLTYAHRFSLHESEYEQSRKDFFAKAQACLRSSPLAKRYGWGFHFDHKGRVAVYGMESAEYRQLKNFPGLKNVKAMRTKRG